MKLKSQVRLRRAGLVSTAVAGMLATASLAKAQVVFNDGQTHVINDATYAFEHIEVRNGTILIIGDGAVISASIDPANDGSSGIPVLKSSAAAVQVFDRSALIVQGGTFGGDRLGTRVPNPYLDNWYSGSIAAFDDATVTIENGTFGRWAYASGTTAVFDRAKLVVSGGTFTDPFDRSPSGLSGQSGGGGIELHGDGRADISGGLLASSIESVDNSVLNISGGTFGKGNFPDGRSTYYRGAVRAKGSAAVTISGGDFGAMGLLSGHVSIAGSSTLKVNGGTFKGSGASANSELPGYLAGSIDVSEDGDAKILGGQFNAAMSVAVGGQLTIDGCAFNLPFGKFSETEVTLQGTLSNGDAINAGLTRNDSPDAIIDLVEDCGGAVAEVPFFLEDFEDGNANDHSPVKWSPYHGAKSPVVVDGSLVLNTSGTQGQGCYSSTYNMLGDVSIRTQMRALKGNAETGVLTVWAHTRADNVSYHGTVGSNYIEIGDDAELKMSAVIPIDIFASDVSVQFDVVGRTLSLTVWKTGEEKPSAPQLTGTSTHDYPDTIIGFEASRGITQFAVRSYDAIRIGDSLNPIPTGPVVPFVDDFSDGDPTDGTPVAWSTTGSAVVVSGGQLLVPPAPDDATRLQNSRSVVGPISIRSEFSLKPPGATALSRVERVGIYAHQGATGSYFAGIYPDGSGGPISRVFLESSFQPTGGQYAFRIDLSKPVVVQLDIQEVADGSGSHTVSVSAWQAGGPIPAKPQIIQTEATLFRKGGRSGVAVDYSSGPIAYNYFSVARDPASHFKPFLLHDFIERKSLQLTVPAGTVLQSSPALFPPQWTDVSGSGSVEMPTTGPAGFFRLRSE